MITIETPVKMKQGYPSEFTKFGLVEKIEAGRATVLWAVEETMAAPTNARRINRHSTVKVSSLSVWNESEIIRLRDEKVSLTASGMEYRTPTV